MTKREGMPKKLRFEVFKRDSFTCQYCGRAAPEVVLQIDHIQPVSKDGDNEITNLVTSCFDCNSGKRARELSDTAVVEKRKRQLDDLQERREQLSMMYEWQRGLINLDVEQAKMFDGLFQELTTFSLNETGLASAKKFIRQYGFSEAAEALRISVDQYLERDGKGKPKSDAVAKVFDYVPKICLSRKRTQERPYLPDLYYIRGILKRRLDYLNQWQALDILEATYLKGAPIEDLKSIAINCGNWTEWKEVMEAFNANLS